MHGQYNVKFEAKVNTHIFMFNIIYFRKSWSLWDNVEKYCTAEQSTDDNMGHAYCMMCT